MPRTRRGRQVEFDPGTSGQVEGRFADMEGAAVAVVVAVRSCDEPGGGEVTVTPSEGEWRVELPPDAVKDLDGLVEDGLAVRLTIVSRPCPEPEQGGEEPPPPKDVFEGGTGIDASVEAPDVGVAALDDGPPDDGAEY